MDSTTAGSGDELVATLEARELWMDVFLWPRYSGGNKAVPDGGAGLSTRPPCRGQTVRRTF